MTPEFRPRVQSPLGMPTTAERLAVAEAAAVLHREPTKDESLVAIACAQLFAAEIGNLDRQIDDLRHQLWDCQQRLIDLRRVMGD